jgi:hypothetical protein
MKPRIKALLIASVPVFLGGIWGMWLLGRTSLLEDGLARALGGLQRRGIATATGSIKWSSLGEARVSGIWGVVGPDTLLAATDVRVHIAPTLALPGRAWVRSVDVGALQLRYKDWWWLGSAQLSPSDMALLATGDFGKGTWGECGLAVAGHGTCSLGPRSVHGGRRQFAAAMHIETLSVQHPALGDEMKTIRELDAWARVEAVANAYTLRPGSCLQVGNVGVQGSARYDHAAHTFDLRLAMPTQPVAEVLAQVQALAPALQGMQVSGAVTGSLRLTGDLDSLSGLQLDGDLQGDGIALVADGVFRLDALRTLAAQPGLVASGDLPPYLVQAVVLSEDANFWTHHGFDREIIRLAIAENWEAGRFVRGAGTIPMQLIRNVFLHHGKQADRKVAEITLTWIAEEVALIDKQAQLKLYLNLIEWGPGVYGIRDAAQFYFHKSPSRLSVDESIFLAAIIPNPRYYAQLLAPDGSLTPYAQEYYDSMRWMLYEGDFIGEEWLEAPYPSFKQLVQGHVAGHHTNALAAR